jgi:hypothetical protein
MDKKFTMCCFVDRRTISRTIRNLFLFKVNKSKFFKLENAWVKMTHCGTSRR